LADFGGFGDDEVRPDWSWLSLRILVTTNAAIGHFLPMAATVAALVASGHEVRVGCPESFEPFVRRAGFEPVGCKEIEVSVPVRPPPPTEEHYARLIWAVTLSWPSDCRPWVDSLLRYAEQWRPDLVMVEPVEHAGRIVAAALGAPLIVHGWGFTLPAQVETSASSGILDLYERLSATPQPPALAVDLGPSDVQASDIGPVLRYRYRYQPFSVPGQPLPPAQGGKRRVLVTLGTYANVAAAALIRTAVSAALDGGADVIAVLGNDDRGSAETFPPGATALQWVDLPAAIASCDLIVHHGGAGTSWTALSSGKPAVVLPHGADQFRNAEILRRAGAALVCPPGAIGDLSAAIRHGLDSTKLTERAAVVARHNAALPDVAALARQLTAPKPSEVG
jgi:UDP:flavonoid glycosyltransferase YjiC (YdhE family)